MCPHTSTYCHQVHTVFNTRTHAHAFFHPRASQRNDAAAAEHAAAARARPVRCGRDGVPGDHLSQLDPGQQAGRRGGHEVRHDPTVGLEGVGVPLTAMWLDENKVVQVKTEDKEGFYAVQVGAGSRRRKRLNNLLLVLDLKLDLTS